MISEGDFQFGLPRVNYLLKYFLTSQFVMYALRMYAIQHNLRFTGREKM